MQLKTMKSVIRDLLQSMDPKLQAAARAERKFYQRIIGEGHDLIFDIGANCGKKTAIFVRLAARVVAAEPSIDAVSRLRWQFGRNPRINIVAKGVGDDNSPRPFHEYRYSGYNSISPKLVESRFPWIEKHSVTTIEMTTVDALIAEFGCPFYVKIDVEGYEHKVLRGLSRPITLLSFECNLPEFLAEGLECIAKLETLSPGASFNFTTEEPPTRFANDTYLSGEEMAEVLRSGTMPYVEIYCFSCKDSRR